MLPAFVQHRHNHRYPFRLAAHRGDNPLQVGKMLVRAHGNLLAEHIIGHIVGTRIRQDVHVVSADALLDHALGLAVAETGTGHVDQEVLPFRAGRCPHVAGLGFFRMVTPFLQPGVDLRAELLRARHRDQPQRSNRISQKRIRVPVTDKISHGDPPTPQHQDDSGILPHGTYYTPDSGV